MRVNISYSAILDDVPYELARLVADVSTRMSSASSALERVDKLMTAELAVTNAAETAQIIDSVRARIAELDTRLGEAEAILAGYYQAKTNPEAMIARQQQASTPAQAEQVEVTQIEEALNGIQEQLQQILADPQETTSEEAEHADL